MRYAKHGLMGMLFLGIAGVACGVSPPPGSDSSDTETAASSSHEATEELHAQCEVQARAYYTADFADQITDRCPDGRAVRIGVEGSEDHYDVRCEDLRAFARASARRDLLVNCSVSISTALKSGLRLAVA